MDDATPQWNPPDAGSPTREVLDRIGDRWTVLTIGALGERPLRYTQLAHRIEGVSQKMLTQTLRGLERDGLISRTVFPVIPPHVEYQLTTLGEDLRILIVGLEDWATKHVDNVLAARDEYARRGALGEVGNRL